MRTFRTIPETQLVNLETRQFEPAELGPPEMTSTAYKYSYESVSEPTVGENGQKEEEKNYRDPQGAVMPARPTNGEMESHFYQRQQRHMPNGFTIVENDERVNVERQKKQTQKVTRVTKVTTTRTVQHIPLDQQGSMGGVEFRILSPIHENGYSDHSDGRPCSGAEIEGFADDEEKYKVDSFLQESSPKRSGAPNQPGIPQIVDIDSDRVTIVWLRPSETSPKDHTTPLLGYQVQYRSKNDTQWYIANENLITEPLCTMENLERNGEYEMRVVAKNANGFGKPSDPILIQLRASNQPVTPVGKNQFDTEVPSAPGKPLVLECDGIASVRLAWEAPVFEGHAGPVLGYQIEYRPVLSKNESPVDWILYNEKLTRENSCVVSGLRPNGLYEFRIRAKNVDGFSEPSTTSQVCPIRRFKGGVPPDIAPKPDLKKVDSGQKKLAPPSQPVVSDFDIDWVTLIWSPIEPSKSSSEKTMVDRSNLHFVVQCREIHDPDWIVATDRPIFGTQITVTNLIKDGQYEFRILARNNQGDQSVPSVASKVVQLQPNSGQMAPSIISHRQVPNQPKMPEIMAVVDDCVTLCWLPAVSPIPIQGYQVEFRECGPLAAQDWLAVNAILTHSCKMTIGDLMPHRQYEFRVIAKNAIGYSKPSEPTKPVFIGGLATPEIEHADGNEPAHLNGYGGPSTSQVPAEALPLHKDYSFSNDVPLPVEMSPAKESPPITDTDDSPPPIRRKPPGADGVTYRDPTLAEVLDYLHCNNNVLKLNAAGYLQHLTFNDEAMKQKVRELDGIPRLIELLRSEVPEIQKNACGCLRNLSFGIDENKKAILNAGGVPALASLLRKTPDMQILEEISGVMWNLSSHDELKLPILDQASEALVRQIVIPYSGWSAQGRFADWRTQQPAVFRNATGVLRNVSSAGGNEARQMLRRRDGLCDALVHYLHMACDQNDYDSKPVENVICLVRNLSYRLQEMEDPNYDKKAPTLGHQRSKSAPSLSPKAGKKKKEKHRKDESASSSRRNLDDPSSVKPLLQQPATGISLLWQPEVVRDYLKLLDQSSNPDTLEGCAGAVQNLAACYWQPSVDLRATVRKEKGLPIIIGLLSVSSDKVVCAAATALRNLALDQRNKDLIGSYAMKFLVPKLPIPPTATASARIPSGNAEPVSEETLAAILSVIYATTVRNAAFSKELLDKGGVDRLVHLSNARQYSHKIVKYAAQVLFAIWQHRELHDSYKKLGFREEDFVARAVGHHSRQADTLARPVSTQGVAADRQRHSLQQGQVSAVRPDWNDTLGAATSSGYDEVQRSRYATMESKSLGAATPRTGTAISGEYETLDARTSAYREASTPATRSMPGGNSNAEYYDQGYEPYSRTQTRESGPSNEAYARVQKRPSGEQTLQQQPQTAMDPKIFARAPHQPMDSWV